MFHGGSDRHYVVNSVATTGRSLNLGKGQFAVVDKSATPTNDGLKIVSSFAGLPKSTQVQLLLGSAGLDPNRSQDNKSYKSLNFKLSEIESLRVSAPKEGIHVDEQILGYNGFDDATSISLKSGDNEKISIKLSGPAIGMSGYADSGLLITENLTAPKGTKNTDWFDEQVVKEAIERLKNQVVLGQRPLSDYVDITPVDGSNSAASGTANLFYNLTVDDKGTHSDLGAVQAQYPGYKVVRTDSTASGSVYSIVAPKTVINATAMVNGKTYIIEVPGTTVFTGIGAADSLAGTRFVKSGSAATGTGTVFEVAAADYVVNKAWLVKGCADCPAGYAEYEDGFVYSVTIEDDGADSTSTVEGISSNTTASSAVRVAIDGGLSTYTVIVSEELSAGEISAFVTTNPESEITLISRDVAEVCKPSNSTSTQWETGDICYTKTDTYTIVVGNDDCNTAPTAAIQAAYPELSITPGTSANCSTKYSTTVITNLVCEECSTAFRDLFISEPPKDYGVHSWTKTVVPYTEKTKLGIRFKAKPFIFAGNEEYRDYVPNLATSVRIQVAGGYSDTVSESFSAGKTAGRYKVTILSVASEPENWGMNLRDWEEAGNVYFSGDARYKKDNYANFVLGKETNLEALQPYVDYVLTVRTKTRTQAFYGENNETIEYHMLVEPGVHQSLENVLNALAGAAGVDTVQAFGKTAV